MTKEEKLTDQFQQLKSAIREFIENAPSFPTELIRSAYIGETLADVEITLHHEFGCWELATPEIMPPCPKGWDAV